MTRKDLDHWAHSFSTDLGTGAARAPFDRIVRHHRSEIQRLLEAHLTFPTLAAALARAGAARADGRPYSPDQLYMAVRRAASPPSGRPKRASAPKTKISARAAEDRASKDRPPGNGSSLTIKDEGSRINRALDSGVSASQPSPRCSGATPANLATTRDLTDEDVSAALRRIRKSD